VSGYILAAFVAFATTAATVSAGPSPYAGMEGRGIKALSESEIADLLAGRGAGMALPAELNQYPGPRHVLELAAELELSPGQDAETRRLFARMQSEAVTLGEAVIAREAELERLFASGTADEGTLRAAVAETAQLRGELRFTHLKYHLAMRRLLTPAQVAAYDAARGYAPGSHHGTGGHGAGAHRR
jgi:Spy/CpxP family protein refolding chaperone